MPVYTGCYFTITRQQDAQWLLTSQASQLVAFSISLRIVDTVLRFKNPRIEFSLVSEISPETSNGRATAVKLNTWKNFILIF